ncbi:MAG TPA: twin-arginine translocation signal domain-containing protein, partial [Bacteroidales bacterium]|nr:twin-arginine translocation signal domain-containing protein [Bacteroidales bacterium]
MNTRSTTRRNFLKIAALGAAGVGLGLKGLASGRQEIPGESPAMPRQQGQRSVMSLACEPLNIVRIGIIGLGMRGMEAVERLLYV